MMDSDSPFEGAVLDPVKCSKLSMDERREIVYELANWSHGAPEMLQTWSRQDILQILCSEMGKERKYTGLTKLKIIEHLLKVVSAKKSQSSTTSVIHKALKRARKCDNPSRLPTLITDHSTTMSNDDDLDTEMYCKNASCKARLVSNDDPFCKRCSCCICHKYDENKDPSLWLTCTAEAEAESCNVSCHLECAVKHEKCGIARNGIVAQLDGGFYCVSCGKMNDLMRCWRKQMTIAKETRRVDILCYRLSLSQILLAGSKKYREICDKVDDAIKKLEAEVGTLPGVSAKTIGRGIVNRLSVGQEVQRLCALAVVSFDSTVCCTPLDHETRVINPNIIKVEEISPTSITVVVGPDTSTESNVAYTLWHHKVDEKEKTEPTCTLVTPNTRFTFSSLSRETEYILRVVAIINTQELTSSEVHVTTSAERSQSPQTNCSTLSNPSKVVEKEHGKKNSSKKRRLEIQEEECDPPKGRSTLEYYIKVIRWLECEGHIDKSFRQKFLTWYGIRATPEETRVVKAFIDILIDDPASLAEQILDTFKEIISSKRSLVAPPGFCLKLWH